MEDTIIEKPKQTLSFIEQLQNQVSLCREALSSWDIPIFPRVEALESLLWAKLSKDKEYLETKKKARESLKKKSEGLKVSEYLTDDTKKYITHKRTYSKQLFKALIVFIDKNKLMPYGEDND